MAKRGMCKVMVIGNLGKAPDARALPSGESISNFSVAVSESWKDKQTGEMKDRTEWISCSVFGKLAEICNTYLQQGSKVYIEGSLRTRSWDQNGETRYKTEVVVSEMQMLDSKPQTGLQDLAGRQAAREAMAPMAPTPADIPFDDDLPF